MEGMRKVGKHLEGSWAEWRGGDEELKRNWRRIRKTLEKIERKLGGRKEKRKRWWNEVYRRKRKEMRRILRACKAEIGEKEKYRERKRI